MSKVLPQSTVGTVVAPTPEPVVHKLTDKKKTTERGILELANRSTPHLGLNIVHQRGMEEVGGGANLGSFSIKFE
jgi:hypothetical protein